MFSLWWVTNWYFVLARLMASDGEKSGKKEVSRQFCPWTSRGAGRLVQFNECSSGDERVSDSVLTRGSMPKV